MGCGVQTGALAGGHPYAMSTAGSNRSLVMVMVKTGVQ